MPVSDGIERRLEGLLIVFLVTIIVLTNGRSLSPEQDMRRFIRDTSGQVSATSTLQPSQRPAIVERGVAPVKRTLANERVCSSVEVNSEVKPLVLLLANCTVVEGFIQIGPIDNIDPAFPWENVSFPLLREVTDYVLLYRVAGLKSLKNLFPNLAVIRSRNMARDYGLVLFENMELEDVGLTSLVSIQRGGVFIWRNALLCYLQTVDWLKIVHKDFYEKISLRENREPGQCSNVCPDNCARFYDSSSRTQRHMCWAARDCQQAPPVCGNDGRPVGCCHRNCLSGCYGPSRNECLVCRVVHHNGACMDVCPEFTYKLSDRRCISEEQCRSHRITDPYKLHSDPNSVGKLCLPSCPARFTNDPTDKNKCIGCVKACPKVCTTSETITSVSEAESFQNKRCTILNGSLEIQIGKGEQMVKALEEALQDLEEVRDYIRIAQSHALVSLGFFKNLRVIRGERLYLGSYALQVMDNQNLESLIDFKGRTPIDITNKAANMSFHYNPRLCLYKIEDFLQQTKHSKYYTTKDISETSNGDRVPCNITALSIEKDGIGYDLTGDVEVRWTTFQELEKGADDFRALLGYIVYYREAPAQNVSTYEGRDACSADVWRRIDVGPHEQGEQTKYAYIESKKLKPARQYAIYVKTFTISTERKGGQTPISYFTTRSKQPSKPMEVRTESVGAGEIKVYWKPPNEPNGVVTYYIVRWYKARSAYSQLEMRDFCRERIQVPRNYFIEALTTTTPSPGTCACNATGSQAMAQKPAGEEEMQDAIDMENFIQDKAFHKPQSVRARRDISSMMWRYVRQVGGSVPTVSTSTVTSGGNGTAVRSNVAAPEILTMALVTPRVTTLKPEIEAVERQVRDRTEFKISDLHHFTDYIISVRACHDTPPPENNYTACSDPSMANPSQTLAKYGADNIPSSSVIVTLDEVNSTSSDQQGHVERFVHVYWNDPREPNGAIVTVEIEHHPVDRENKSRIECIPRTQRERPYAKLDFSTAHAGNYSFRLRATSFASNGSWTEPKYITVEAVLTGAQAGVSMNTLGGIIGGVVAALLILCGGVIYYLRKHMRKPPQSANVVSINPDYYAYKPDEWEVPRENIELGRKLGSGTFGDVYEAIAKNIMAGVERLIVAVKTVNEDKSPSERNYFLQEASVMKNFRCNHVVKLLGVVSEGQPALVIMEYMANSDLKTWLRNQRPDDELPDRKPLAITRVLQMAGEICDGMAYIHSRKFVHRDLAARNCMVADDLTVKIGDFGMTRDVYETDYYRKGGKGLLPVRWMGPESLKDGIFTIESDVWSFGVVLYEIATLAEQPYKGWSNEQVLQSVTQGFVIPQKEVEKCPDRIYDMMKRCWKFNPHERPTFLQLIEELLPDLNDAFRQNSYFSTVDINDVSPPADAEPGGDGLLDPTTRVVSLLRDPEMLNGYADAEEETETDQLLIPPTEGALPVVSPSASLEPVVIVHENGSGLGDENGVSPTRSPILDGPYSPPKRLGKMSNGGNNVNGLLLRTNSPY